MQFDGFPRHWGLVAAFERCIRCSLLEHCLQEKTPWQLTEKRAIEEGVGPIHNPSFNVIASHNTQAQLSVSLSRTCKYAQSEDKEEPLASHRCTLSQSLPRAHSNTHTLDREQAIMMPLLIQRWAESPHCAVVINGNEGSWIMNRMNVN